MKRARFSAAACIGASLLGALAYGCTSGESSSDATRQRSSASDSQREGLRPVSLPDLSPMTPSVQTQLQESHDALMRQVASRDTPAADLGAAYGKVGKLLMAAQCFDAAEPYLSNARTLLPTDGRWPYFLGHVARTKGRLPDALSFFEEAVERRPEDVAALIWLGDVYLASGRPDDAESPLKKALEKDGRSVATLYRLGRVAMARRDYAGAVKHLEEALAVAPSAPGLHYPLGLAYRGLGDQARAQAHLGREHALEGLAPPDPLMQELNELLNSPTSWEARGVRALNRGDWATAAVHFRRGAELDPKSPSLRHRLGSALYMMGDAQGALREFERAISISPKHAQSHYSLAVLLESKGRVEEALQGYSAAVRYEPTYVEARIRLADLLGRVGRPDASLAEYNRALSIDPRVPEAAFGYAMALVALGRYKEALKRMEQGTESYPGELDFAYAMARVLAAAPDASVRDGRRALAVMAVLTDEQQRKDGGETMAMALAEVGRFGEAVVWQRGAISAAERAGQPEVAARMAENLKLYEKGQPCRTSGRNGELRVCAAEP